VTARTPQLAGGALPHAGSNGENCSDAESRSSSAENCAAGSPQSGDFGFREVPCLHDPAVSGDSTTFNCVTLQRQGQLSGEQKGCSSMARKRYQKGTLVKQGKREPKWFGQYREDVVDSSGEVHRVWRKVLLGTKRELPTRKLAQRRFDLVLSRINAPAYRPGRVATFAEFVETWQRDALVLSKPSSRKAAESHLRCYLIPRLGKIRLEEISQQTTQQLVSELAKKLSRHTVLNILATLGSILRAARSWGYIVSETNRRALVLPAAKVARPVRYFSAEQVGRIIGFAREEPYRTMFIVAALTGLRAGEVCGLSIDDLDFARKLIHVRQSAWYGKIQTPKSRAAIRSVPIPGVLCEVLQFYLRQWEPNPARLLFATRTGKPHSANKVVQRKLWPILDALKVPRCGFHAFRHAASTLLIDLGASPKTVQAQLGHSDASITLDAYSHVVEASRREAVERLARILMPNDAESSVSTEWIQ
jgi:integrase